MEHLNKNAPSRRGAAKGAKEYGEALDPHYSTPDWFRIALIHAHLIACYPSGCERKRAILHFLAALKCALGVKA